ncbi:hypothetical protein Cgig2_020251 [Carnegiea gigantea]|uniref:Uncharacterized protein n=1 Tax=Carnegiea gigantea TaxID=171969 RepID=A0A9Q1QQN8_9CARY|nr:hypothetical protein Cgig2_020251 [Carnegiea gigantea]
MGGREQTLELDVDEDLEMTLNQLILVGRVLADRIVNKNGVKSMLQRAWNLRIGVAIADITENTATKPQIQRTSLLDISNVSSPRTHANKVVPHERGSLDSGKLEGRHVVIGDYSTTITELVMRRKGLDEPNSLNDGGTTSSKRGGEKDLNAEITKRPEEFTKDVTLQTPLPVSMDELAFNMGHQPTATVLENDKPVWGVVGIYGWSEIDKKYKTWMLMKQLKNKTTHPYYRTKEGKIIKECLDRFLGDEDWSDSFPNSRVSHFPRYRSDHCAIMLEIEHK